MFDSSILFASSEKDKSYNLLNMKIKKHNVSNPNVNRDIGDFIKKTVLQYYHGSMSVDEFIDKCDYLSMQYNSLQIKQFIKIQRTKYSNFLKTRGQECYINCQSPTQQNETSRNEGTSNIAHKIRERTQREETPEERHKRNGDKNIDFGYSSTGVPLPTEDQMAILRKPKKKKRKPFSKAAQCAFEKRFIRVPIGGKTSRY